MAKKLAITYLPIESIKPFDGNARTHSAWQIEQIANSIRAFGFVAPLLVDGEGNLIAGHGRLAAARKLGMRQVPVVFLEHLSNEQSRLLRLADNRLAELSAWDDPLLKREFKILSDLDLTLDLNITGFSSPAIDLLLSDNQQDQEEEAPPDPPATASAVTRLGDIWQIGGHRVFCADLRDRPRFRSFMNGRLAQLVFTDPPYNVRIQGFAGGKGKTKHREFAHASGEMSQEDFASFLRESLGAIASVCADGALVYVFIDWRHVDVLVAAGRETIGALINIVVWSKTNPGMGSFYRSAHELIPVFHKGNGKAINNVELGRHGRNRSNVWTYASVNSFAKHRRADYALHPTPKPVALVADAIRDASRRGGIVLDGFAGSGATLVAAHRTGRIGYGVEIDPSYCDVIVARLSQESGESVVLEETGESFDSVKESRQRATGENES